MKVLVVNCGSSSIKYKLFEMPDENPVAKGVVDRIGKATSKITHTVGDKKIELTEAIKNHDAGLKRVLEMLSDKKTGVISDISAIKAVGHRVVHGGEKFTGSVLITDTVRKAIEENADLAPLHNPPNLAGIDAASRLLPKAVQVAAFDTAFHQTIPEVAYLYAIPHEFYEKFRIRKYGFHGTSHRYVARRGAQLMGIEKDSINAITCHLGNGCSITAVENGKSVDTSMGFTPLEGLIMGTRSGDIDPAIIFYLAKKGMTAEDINEMLNKQSGLLGVSGVSNDLRSIQKEVKIGNKKAQLAVDMFCYKIRKYIGAYSAVLGKVDVLVFTGGIGENAFDIREKICDKLKNLGIILNMEKNRNTTGQESLISSKDSAVKVFVIPTDEEVRIAVDTFAIAREGMRGEK